MSENQSSATRRFDGAVPAITHCSKSPLFVIGHARSGTSIFGDLVRKYLRIALGSESQFFIRYCRRLPAYGDLALEASRRSLLVDVSRERFFERSRKYGVLLDVDRAVREASPTYRGVLEAIMSQSAECQQMERWGDKTPEYSRHLPKLFELFPTAQFIHVVRDGRDVALSGYGTHFGAKNAYAAACEWRLVLAEIDRFGRSLPTSQFMELRYEDLLTRTDVVFTRLISFLNIEDRNGNLGDAIAHSARADLRSGNFGKWRTQLSPHEQEMFATVAGAWLSRFGYELTPSTRKEPTGLAAVYWRADNVLRRMLVPQYWGDNFYKLRLRAREQRSALRSRISARTT